MGLGDILGSAVEAGKGVVEAAGDLVATTNRSHREYCEWAYAQNEKHCAELFHDHPDWYWGKWKPGEPLRKIPFATWMFKVDTV